MKTGQLVEVADTETLFEKPSAPYTQELLALMPKLNNLSLSGLEIEGS